MNDWNESTVQNVQETVYCFVQWVIVLCSQLPQHTSFNSFDYFLRSDPNWWLATSMLTKREGYVPRNYIEPADVLQAEE